MAMSKPSLERMIRGIREDLLRQPVKDTDIGTIAKKITEWQAMAPFLGLTAEDEEDIEESGKVKVQRITTLKIWSRKFTDDATYMKLIQIFWDQDRLDLAEVVCDVLRKQQNAPPPAPPVQPPTQVELQSQNLEVSTSGGLIRSNGGPYSGTSIGSSSQAGSTESRVATDSSSPLPYKGASNSGADMPPSIQFLSDFKPETHGVGAFDTEEELRTAFPSKYYGLEQNERRGEGTTVAVLDTGINLNHLAFQSKFQSRNIIRVNFTTNPDDPNDDIQDIDGHGSHCAGVVAGSPCKCTVGDKTVQFPGGVAHGARLVVCRVAKDRKHFDSAAIVGALNWLIKEKRNTQESVKVDIVVMSFGAPSMSTYLDIEGKILDLTNLGVTCIAAAGNSGMVLQNALCYPALFDNVICIGAHGSKGKPAPCTPIGGDIDYLGPGVDIYAPSYENNDGLMCASGTSCAAPAVAGLVCMLIQRARKLPYDMQIQGRHVSQYVSKTRVIRQLLKEISSSRGVARDKESGFGSLDPRGLFQPTMDDNDFFKLVNKLV